MPLPVCSTIDVSGMQSSPGCSVIVGLTAAGVADQAGNALASVSSRTLVWGTRLCWLLQDSFLRDP